MRQPASPGEPAEPLRVQVGSRTLVIDTSQWMGFPIVPQPGPKPIQPNDTCLVLRCARWQVVLGAVGILCGMLAAGLEVVYRAEFPEAFPAVLVLWLAAWAWHLTSQARFDRGA